MFTGRIELIGTLTLTFSRIKIIRFGSGEPHEIPSNNKRELKNRILNIARKDAYFLAFVKLTDTSNAADVIASSVTCNGAPVLKLVRSKLFPHSFAAIFSRGKLVKVTPDTNV